MSTDQKVREPVLTNSGLKAFVERRYRDGEIDWLWVKNARPTDVDCTTLTPDQLAERIQQARAA